MNAPASGRLTFLFTDMEGSTRRWEEQPEGMADALARHDALLREAIEGHGGQVFKTVGDAFHAAFEAAPDALEAAIACQRALAAAGWGDAVRIALHSGDALRRDGDYFGPTLNRVARLRDAAHGGQILVSAATAALLTGRMADDVDLRDLGAHRLKDLPEPEQIYLAVVPDLRGDFRPLRTEDAWRRSLPTPATPLVGRERDLDEIERRLADGRLVTLTGPGGTGKTRLALAIAGRVQSRYADGVYFVDLSALREAALVAPAIGQVLGIRESETQPAADALRAFLHGKHLLLVLDNFEQVVEAATLAADVLATCPRLSILVTSRVLLRVSGEREHGVAPLAVPDLEVPADAGGLAAVPSVDLFLQRARDARPGFALTAQNADAVAQVCVRLDGLPLALELAAARLRVLSPEALLARLEQRFALLTGGGRDAPMRHRTLRDTIAWSYELLTPAEQSLFRGLTIFSGGCTLESAAAVRVADGGLGIDALDGLGSLVEKSLVRRQEGSAGDDRFVLLETLREFGREQLGPDEAASLRRRHALHFADLADAVAGEMYSGRYPRWIDRLDAERDNVWAAARWAIDAGDAETALRLVGGQGWYWRLRGRITSGRRLALTALALPGAVERTPARGRALVGAGFVGRDPLNPSHARALLEESVSIFREIGDDLWLAHALSLLGIEQRDPAVARPLLDESRALYAERNDTGGLARVALYQGLVAFNAGDATGAREEFERALGLARSIADPWHIGIALYGLGMAAARGGNAPDAWRFAEESLGSLREAGDMRYLGLALALLSRLAMQRGEMERVVSFADESIAVARRAGDPRELSDRLLDQANLLIRLGDPRAAALLDESLRHNEAMGRDDGLVNCLRAAGRLAAARGDATRAARLLGAVEAHQELTGAPPASTGDADDPSGADEVRTALGDDAFAAAWTEGRRLTLDEAVALARAAAV